MAQAQPATMCCQPTATAAPSARPTTGSNTGPKKNLLEALRDKYGNQYMIQEVKEAQNLNIEDLQACWNTYAETLNQQQKHSASATFRIAQLEIVDEIHFIVKVGALTAQKFIEQERMLLIDHIQQHFNNRAITFKILVEAGEREDVPLHMRLKSKEKFEYLAQQYPQLRELKDKLKLEIDF